MITEKIDDAFISYASDMLADTNRGLSGAQIVKYCNSYAVDFGVNIPVTSPDFGKFGSIIPNKRTALTNVPPCTKTCVNSMEVNNLSLSKTCVNCRYLKTIKMYRS